MPIDPSGPTSVTYMKTSSKRSIKIQVYNTRWNQRNECKTQCSQASLEMLASYVHKRKWDN